MTMKRRSGLFLLVPLSLAFCLPSCRSTERFERPRMDVPEGVDASQDAVLSIHTRPRWWQVFHSSNLDRLEERAFLYNRDLAHAAAVVDKAAAMASAEAAGELPHALLKAGAARQELTKGQQYSQSLPERGRDLWQASGILSYEVDLWGKLRMRSGAAQADMLASAAARDAVWLRLSAEVASGYISVCTWQEKCDIIRRVHESYEQTCSMYEKRFEQGQYPELALRRVQAERDKTLAQLRKAENELSKAESILAVLVGESPRAIISGGKTRGREELLSMTPPAIPAGIPADVIDRRPDICEWEMRLRAAHERKEAARVDRYPSLVLTGELGHVSTALEEVLNQPTRLYDIGGSVLQTLFDGGRKRAALDAASAEYKTTEAAYEQSVLVAFREIRDALVERRQGAAIYDATKSEVDCLRRSWDIASRQYDAGYIGLMDALDTHRSLLNGELEMADAAEMRLNAVVKLCKALGGGWKRS